MHLIRNDVNQFFGEAFVLFGGLEDIELALEGIYGNRIHNKFVKVYRSSKEQFRNYCIDMPFETSMGPKNGHSTSVADLGKNCLTFCSSRLNFYKKNDLNSLTSSKQTTTTTTMMRLAIQMILK